MVPTTTSAPNLPGASSFTKLKISAAIATLICASLALAIKDFMSVTCPFFPGYCKIAPKNPEEKSNVFSSPTTSSTPIGLDLVCKRESVCGNTYLMLKNSRFSKHFEYSGSFDTHLGKYEDCGDIVTPNAPSSCC